MEVLEEWQEREGIYACFLATLPDPREGGGGGHPHRGSIQRYVPHIRTRPVSCSCSLRRPQLVNLHLPLLQAGVVWREMEITR